VYLRLAFVVLTVAGGWGVVLYLIAWFALGKQTLQPGSTPTSGYMPIAKGASPRSRMLGLAMVVGGLVVLSSIYGLSFLGSFVWPTAFIGAAIAMALDRSWFERLRGDLEERTIGGRVILGLGLLFAGLISASVISFDFWEAIGGIIVGGLVLVGAGIVFAPIVTSLGTDLMAERRRRIRSEEKAEMAAHLHDSVLQTLTLIQKRSTDSSVVSLARRQERELRTWLFDDKAMNPNMGFRAGLEAAMGNVEELYEVPVEVVVVGDCSHDPDVAALLQASREAAANAAKHSGAPRVDVFAEVGQNAIEVFVRDQGVGFDPALVDHDRAGVRDSIVGRMERHGGTATVHSDAGSGTEVELQMPRRNQADLSEVETF
jgi:signal transduction histidine kinase